MLLASPILTWPSNSTTLDRHMDTGSSRQFFQKSSRTKRLVETSCRLWQMTASTWPWMESKDLMAKFFAWSVWMYVATGPGWSKRAIWPAAFTTLKKGHVGHSPIHVGFVIYVEEDNWTYHGKIFALMWFQCGGQRGFKMILSLQVTHHLSVASCTCQVKHHFFSHLICGIATTLVSARPFWHLVLHWCQIWCCLETSMGGLKSWPRHTLPFAIAAARAHSWAIWPRRVWDGLIVPHSRTGNGQKVMSPLCWVTLWRIGYLLQTCQGRPCCKNACVQMLPLATAWERYMPQMFFSQPMLQRMLRLLPFFSLASTKSLLRTVFPVGRHCLHICPKAMPLQRCFGMSGWLHVNLELSGCWTPWLWLSKSMRTTLGRQAAYQGGCLRNKWSVAHWSAACKLLTSTGSWVATFANRMTIERAERKRSLKMGMYVQCLCACGWSVKAPYDHGWPNSSGIKILVK